MDTAATKKPDGVAEMRHDATDPPDVVAVYDGNPRVVRRVGDAAGADEDLTIAPIDGHDAVSDHRCAGFGRVEADDLAGAQRGHRFPYVDRDRAWRDQRPHAAGEHRDRAVGQQVRPHCQEHEAEHRTGEGRVANDAAQPTSEHQRLPLGRTSGRCRCAACR